MYNKLFNSKKSRVIFGTVLIVLFFALITPLPAKAFFGLDIGVTLVNIIIWISNTILEFIAGNLLGLIAAVSQMVLNYTTINDAEVVKTGFSITLGLANMFFVFVLLIIAIATMLGIEKYSAKQLLPTLIISAVLINFSKVIAGVVIDFGQILTQFFLDQIGSNPSVAIANAMRIPSIFPTELPAGTSASLTGLGNLLGGILASWIFAIAAILVFTSFTILLFVRIFALWFLVIGAPLVWLFRILPQTQDIWQKWWKKFFDWVFVAPVFAFFLYLALATARNVNAPPTDPSVESKLAKTSALLKPSFLFNYVIFIGILAFGVKTAKGMGAVMPDALGAAWKGFKKGTGMDKGLEKRIEKYAGKAGDVTSKVASRIPGAGLVLPKAGEYRKEKLVEKGAIAAGKKALSKPPERPEKTELTPEENERLEDLKKIPESERTEGEAEELKKLQNELEKTEKAWEDYGKAIERYNKFKGGELPKEELLEAGYDEIKKRAAKINNRSKLGRIGIRGLTAVGLTALPFTAESKMNVSASIFSATAKSMKAYTPKARIENTRIYQEMRGGSPKEGLKKAIKKWMESEEAEEEKPNETKKS